MKKVTIVFLLCSIMSVPLSCTEECGAGPPQKLSIKELQVRTGSYAMGRFNEEEDTNFRFAAIQVKISDIDFVTGVDYHLNNPFIRTACACSPPPPEAAENLRDIRIISDENIQINQTEYGAGTDLTHLFVVKSFGELSIEEFLLARQQDSYFFYNIDQSFVLGLKDNPDNLIDQNFTVIVALDDNRIFSLDTGNFVVIP